MTYFVSYYHQTENCARQYVVHNHYVWTVPDVCVGKLDLLNNEGLHDTSLLQLFGMN